MIFILASETNLTTLELGCSTKIWANKICEDTVLENSLLKKLTTDMQLTWINSDKSYSLMLSH